MQSPCVGNCAGKTCGDDGCGGSCGTCASGQLCADNVETGLAKCAPYPQCNSLQPMCPGGCAVGQYCGSECKCVNETAELMDLVSR